VLFPPLPDRKSPPPPPVIVSSPEPPERHWDAVAGDRRRTVGAGNRDVGAGLTVEDRHVLDVASMLLLLPAYPSLATPSSETLTGVAMIAVPAVFSMLSEY